MLKVYLKCICSLFYPRIFDIFLSTLIDLKERKFWDEFIREFEHKKKISIGISSCVS